MNNTAENFKYTFERKSDAQYAELKILAVQRFNPNNIAANIMSVQHFETNNIAAEPTKRIKLQPTLQRIKSSSS